MNRRRIGSARWLRLRDRGLHLRNLGAYHFVIAVPPPRIPLPLRGACAFCDGDVWCGRCRRCATRHYEPLEVFLERNGDVIEHESRKSTV